MIASYILLVVCVVLCTVHAVDSYSIRGTIKHDNGTVHEVNVSNYVDGENLLNEHALSLDRLVDAKTLPTLTIANFKYMTQLILKNIALEHVPVFINTSSRLISITGNKIKSVPVNAFSGPQPWLIDLRNNEILSMADRSVNIGAIDVVLSCNKLSHFSQSWFEDPGNIEMLNLEGNRIEHIQDRAFNQMTKLYRLKLGYNRITSIGSEAFGSGITSLYLQFNDFAQLSLDMFAQRDKPIGILHLHHNQLGYLSEALLLKFKPSFITLFGNPWQCQCLRDIERWLRELNSTRSDSPARRGEPVCVVPVNFQNVCIPVVDTELQQTYERGLSPVRECWATPCQCNPLHKYLARLT